MAIGASIWYRWVVQQTDYTLWVSRKYCTRWGPGKWHHMDGYHNTDNYVTSWAPIGCNEFCKPRVQNLYFNMTGIWTHFSRCSKMLQAVKRHKCWLLLVSHFFTLFIYWLWTTIMSTCPLQMSLKAKPRQTFSKGLPLRVPGIKVSLRYHYEETSE